MILLKCQKRPIKFSQTVSFFTTNLNFDLENFPRRQNLNFEKYVNCGLDTSQCIDSMYQKQCVVIGDKLCGTLGMKLERDGGCECGVVAFDWLGRCKIVVGFAKRPVWSLGCVEILILYTQAGYR